MLTALPGFRFARLILIANLLLLPAGAAVLKTTLQPETVSGWNDYIDRFEHTNLAARPILNAQEMTLVDLNPAGDIPGGYVHHWIGAMYIPQVGVAKARSVIEDYNNWTQIYAPDVRLSSATGTPEAYDLRMISEQVDGLLHFAFDMHFRVQFSQANGFQLVQSRSYLIRESDSGHAPYTDLLPEGDDHGILWRLNTYWRLKQVGTSTYAECQVISLSRRPILGSTSHVKARARNSLKSTLLHTANSAASR